MKTSSRFLYFFFQWQRLRAQGSGLKAERMNGCRVLHSTFLYTDPYDADDDVHALALAAVVFEAPHAVRLLVPEGLGGGMHATSADVGLPVRGGRGGGVGARADVGFVALGVAATLGLVEGRGRHQVLHDSAVDDVLERWRLRARGRGLRDNGSEDGVDDGRVPTFNFGMFVVFGATHGYLASVHGDLP